MKDNEPIHFVSFKGVEVYGPTPNSENKDKPIERLKEVPKQQSTDSYFNDAINLLLITNVL